jgi:hypothetical protein
MDIRVASIAYLLARCMLSVRRVDIHNRSTLQYNIWYTEIHTTQHIIYILHTHIHKLRIWSVGVNGQIRNSGISYVKKMNYVISRQMDRCSSEPRFPSETMTWKMLRVEPRGVENWTLKKLIQLGKYSSCVGSFQVWWSCIPSVMVLRVPGVLGLDWEYPRFHRAFISTKAK